MSGYPYVVVRRGLRTDVIGLKVEAKPEDSGFDWHYLYNPPISNNPKRQYQKAKFNRLPYRQLA